MEYSGQYIKRVGTLKNSSRDGAYILRYRPDGKHLAVTGGLNPHIYIYDVETGKRIKKLDKQTKRAEQLSYSGDGKYLVNRRYSKVDKKSYFVVRDVEKNYKLIRDNIVISRSGRFYYPAPNGKIIVPAGTRNVGTGKGKSKLNLYTPPQMHTEEFWHNEEGFDNFAISPDGKYMADIQVDYLGEMPRKRPDDYRQNLRIWKYPEMTLVKTINNVHNSAPAALTWSWDSRVLYTNTYIDRKTNTLNIKLWDTAIWQPIQKHTSHKSKITNVFFLPDNRNIFGYSRHTRLFQLVNCYTDEVIEEIEFPDATYPYAMAQNPVKKNQFAFAFNTEIWLYEIELPTQLKEN